MISGYFISICNCKKFSCGNIKKKFFWMIFQMYGSWNFQQKMNIHLIDEYFLNRQWFSRFRIGFEMFFQMLLFPNIFLILDVHWILWKFLWYLSSLVFLVFHCLGNLDSSDIFSKFSKGSPQNNLGWPPLIQNSLNKPCHFKIKGVQ